MEIASKIERIAAHPLSAEIAQLAFVAAQGEERQAQQPEAGTQTAHEHLQREFTI